MKPVCSTEGCSRPVHARGICSRCYDRLPHRAVKRNERWKAKYHGNEAFRERVKANAKRCAIQNPERNAQIAEYVAAHPEKRLQWQRAYRAKRKEALGVGHSAKFYPGKVCFVPAAGKVVTAEIAGGAYRHNGPWCVDVRMPWGEVVRFKTSEVRWSLKEYSERG